MKHEVVHWHSREYSDYLWLKKQNPMTTYAVEYTINQDILEQLHLLHFSNNCSLFFPPCDQSVNIQLIYCSDSASADWSLLYLLLFCDTCCTPQANNNFYSAHNPTWTRLCRQVFASCEAHWSFSWSSGCFYAQNQCLIQRVTCRNL